MLRKPAWWPLLLLAFVSQAGAEEATEAAVKAAFLYKFASYVEWPADTLRSPDTPFVFAVMGADDVATELERIVPGKIVHGHPAAVRRVKEGATLSGVHVLFIGRGQANLPELLRVSRQPGVLTVTESEHGLEMGSVINFIVSGDRVGFEVSVASAESSGLKISSRMLNVARRVVSRG